jgi:hypothetical protein
MSSGIPGVDVVECKVEAFRGTCTLQAESSELLKSSAVKHMVLQQAQAKGLSRAGLSGEPDIYPIGNDGNPINPLERTATALNYRGVYKIAGGI